MRPARAGAGGEGLRPVFVGDLSAASRSSAADPRMGLSVSDGGVRLAQTQPQKPVLVLRYGLLDAQQRGNLSAGDQGQTQAAVGGRTSVSYQPHRAAQQKAGCSAGKIVALMGDLPRIELFARQKTPGWDIWGNELPNSIEM